MFSFVLLASVVVLTIPAATAESAALPSWNTAEHDVAVKYSSKCDLRVRTAGKTLTPPVPSLVPPLPSQSLVPPLPFYEQTDENGVPLNQNWNGGITFHAYDKELLYIGLYPDLNKLAVRNNKFSRGSTLPNTNYRVVNTTYPVPDEEGNRDYDFYFTASGFGITSGHDTMLIYIPYDELTTTHGFARAINSVTFSLIKSPGNKPILLQYYIACPGVFVKTEDNLPPPPPPPPRRGPPPPVHRGCSGDRCVVKPGKKDAILGPGERISSKNGDITLLMQEDGNLVLYCRGGIPVWHANTWVSVSNQHQLRIKNSGEMIVENTMSQQKWSSYTDGNPRGVTLVAQDDNNLVLYTKKSSPGGLPIWHSNTAHSCN